MGVEWPETVITTQRNWIGKSQGIVFEFPVCELKENVSATKSLLFLLDNGTQKIEVFTTRPETIFGTSFLALSYDHPLLKEVEVS